MTDSNEIKSSLLEQHEDNHPYLHLLSWWLVILLFAFGLYIASDLGYLKLVYERDRSYLTTVITLLAIITTAHACMHIVRRSYLLNQLDNSSNPEPLSRVTLTPKDNHSETELDVIAERMRSTVELGWFLVDLAIRLGLAGTIIGFILIFTSLSGETIVGENALRELLVSMSGGMGTALFTTLTGLVCATFLSFQYMILGRLTERIIAQLMLNQLPATIDATSHRGI